MIPFTLPLILDGGTGSELIKRGMPGGVSTEKWILDNPHAILDLQSKYAASGSTAVLAPTFHCNSLCLADYGLGDMADEYNARLAALSRQAVAGKAMVLGDLSPAARIVKPIGDADFEDIYTIYSEQVRALEAVGVDGYIVETVMTMAEMRALTLAVRDNSQKPLFASFTVTAAGRTPLSGTNALAGLITLQEMGIDAFGFNCSMGPEQILQQIRRIAPYAHLPLLAKPNAGMPTVVDGKTVYNCTPEQFADPTRALAEAGVRLFGGCCGTDPDYIAALKKELDAIDFAALPGVEKVRPVIALAGEREAYFFDADVEIKPIACDEDMGDESEDFPGIVRIAIETAKDLEIFADNAYTLTCGLCLTGGDEALYEAALRAYHGRACYDDSGSLSGAFVDRMRKKYGLLVL